MILDRRTSAVLTEINKLCCDGDYAIVEKGEFISAFPRGCVPSDEELIRIFGYLKARELIDLRYAEEGVYCVCPLPEGRRYFEQLQNEKTENRRRLRAASVFIVVFSFFGALLGSFFAVLLTR